MSQTNASHVEVSPPPVNILATISDAIFCLDQDWRFTYLNEQAARLMQRPGGLLGKTLWDEFPQAADLKFGREYRRAASENQPVAFEEFYPPFNAWYFVRAYPHETGLVVFLQDIDRHKKREQKLAEQIRLKLLRAEISQSLARDADFTSILQKCCELLVQHLPAAFARIWTLNRAEQALELQASAGLYTHLNGAHARVKVGDFKIGRIAQNARPHLSNSVTTDPEVSDQAWARREGMVGFAGYPLILEGEVAGVLAMFSRQPLSDSVLEELGYIANGIAQWIKFRQTEKELQTQQKWFQVTLGSIGDAVIATDEKGGIVFLNPVAEALTRWTSQAAFGKPVAEIFKIVNEGTREAVENPVEQVFRDKKTGPLAQHTILIAKDGSEVHIEESAAPIRNASGQMAGVVLVFHEVSRRRQLEKEKDQSLEREMEARLEAEILLRVGSSLSAELDLQHLAQLATDAGTELSGARFGAFFYSPGEGRALMENSLSGVHGEEFTHYASPVMTEMFTAIFRGEGPIRLDNLKSDPRHLKHGVTPPHQENLPVCSYLAVPVISVAGEVIGGMFFGHPEPGIFTERVERLVMGIAGQTAGAVINARQYRDLQHTKEALARQTDDLELRVNERTLKLQETISELESYSYSISHDMRAPLRAMKGYSDILLAECGGVLTEAQQGYLHKIASGARRLDHFIQDVLNYSRMSRAEFKLDQVDFEKLARDITEQYPGLQPPQAEIQLLGPWKPLWANEATLTQCISNLLGNAIKFVAPGVVPQVKVWPEYHGATARIYFQDNGIGIAPRDLERIFGIFVKVHSADAYTGTGIGLSIVRKAMEKMGGQVGVTSELGRGACFWLELKVVGGDESLN